MTKFAVVFPGQGSQSPGMLGELAEQFPVIKETFDEASESLDYDLWDLVQTSDADQLRQTEITQPAMFVSGMAVWRMWQLQGLPQPDFVAGHSLGEYTALTAAGVFQYPVAVKLVALRGRLMASAVEPGVGGMAALLGMDDDVVVELCRELHADDAVVEAVNFNSPGQVVISGHISALEKTCEVARERGARKAMLLPVSVPNHSSLMLPAQAELAAAISAAHASQPAIPVVQNLTAAVPDSVAALIESLQQHVVSPVYWTDSVRFLAANDIANVCEFGPGKVLTGLCKRIDRSVVGHAVESPASLQKAVTGLTAETA